MATRFAFTCSDCKTAEVYRVRRTAEQAMSRHRCPNPPGLDALPLRKCSNCTRRVHLTVGDSDLCVTCDALLFPSVPARAVA